MSVAARNIVVEKMNDLDPGEKDEVLNLLGVNPMVIPKSDQGKATVWKLIIGLIALALIAAVLVALSSQKDPAVWAVISAVVAGGFGVLAPSN